MSEPSIFSFHKKSLLLIILLGILTFLSFSPVLKAQFLNWDDDRSLTANVNVLNFDWPHIKVLLTEPVNGVYTPLTSLSLALEYQLFGLNPFIFHLNNLLLHICVVGLVFFFALNLGLNEKEAFLGAFIFALHPVKVESVAWITERKDVLYAVFYMAALLNYQKGKVGRSFVCGFLSMLAKPMALSLPLVMLLLDWYEGKKFDWKAVISKWPFFIMVTVIGWQTYSEYARIPISNIAEAPLIWIWTFIFYIQKFLIPQISLPIYSLPKPISLFSWAYGSSLVVFILLLAGVWFTRKNKLIVFAFVFYVFSIFYLLRFDDTKDINIVADRFLYVSSLGFCLLAAKLTLALYEILRKQEPIIRHLFSVAVVALMVGFVLLTYQQTQVWHDTVTLWRHQIKFSPHPVACNNLANALRGSREYNQAEHNYREYRRLKINGIEENKENFDDGQFKKIQEVVNLYRQAITLDRKSIAAYYNLADLYLDTAQYDDALVWYHKALTVDSKNKDVLLGLGVLYQRINKPQQAINTFKEILKENPEDEDAYINIINLYTRAIASNPQSKVYQESREDVLSQYEQLSKRKRYSAADYFNLGFLYEQVGGYEEAIRFYKKSLDLNPTYEKALFGLANRFQEMGDLKSALVAYQHLVRSHPKHALAYLNMGVIYNSMGNLDQARMFYQKTLGVDPGNAGAYFNLGYLNETSGNLKEALNFYEKAVEYDPHLAEGYYNIGNVYAALGQTPEAIASYLKTVGINKNHQDAFVNLSILSFKSKDFVGAIHYLEEAQILGYTPPVEYLKSLELYRKKN